MRTRIEVARTGNAGAKLRPARTRHRTHKRRAAARAVTLLVGILIGLGSGHLMPSRAAALETPGTGRCTTDPAATTVDYLVGMACPPAGFAEAVGYEPVLVHTIEGWRFTRPAWADGRCNGPIRNQGPFWNFGMACRTHDYGYDLVRFGVGDRADADALLYRDMTASCGGQWVVGSEACRALADWARTVLGAGDALGFDPEPLESA